MRRTSLNQVRLLQLIENVYAASEDIRLWEPLLMSLAGAVGGTSACVISHDLIASGSPIVTAGHDPEAVALYNTHYHKVDAWALAPSTPLLVQTYPTLEDEAVLSRREFERTEFYPFARKYDISRMMLAIMRVDQHGAAGLSVYRKEIDAAFGTRETAFLRTLAPHVSRALRMYEQFARAAHEREAALEGLDAIPAGVMLISGESRVIYANRTAETILSKRDGLFLDRSCLTTSAADTTSLICRLCAECAKTTLGVGLSAGGAIAVPRSSGRRHLHVTVCPLKRAQPLGLRDPRVAAIVFVSDPDRGALPDAGLLQLFYGLTPAEAEVAARLAVGQSTEEIAEACRYTKETVRWYCKQLLSKVGCRNRAGLVRELGWTLSSLTVEAAEGARSEGANARDL